MSLAAKELMMTLFSKRMRIPFCMVVLLFFSKTMFCAEADGVIVGAARIEEYRALLKDKRVVLAANAGSVIDGEQKVHCLDFLLANGINVTKVFAPEHGFRGNKEAGEAVRSGVDRETGVQIISLYGKSLKPLPGHFEDIDIAVYDIQDVGTRFFTYISTLHYIMEACAENGIPLVIFDRPNPNIDCVAGPVREENARSFVGMDPIPLCYGMTAAELAQMMNGQGWLKDRVQCSLSVIPVKNYTRKTRYEPPIPPSPNLSTYRAVRFYPFMGLFEATVISEGRGTPTPFTAAGYPDKSFGPYVFTPKEIKGMASNPKHKGMECYGIDLSEMPLYSDTDGFDGLFTLAYFMQMAKKVGSAQAMVNQKQGLTLLWGNDRLIEQIDGGMSEAEIRKTWLPGVEKFLQDRKPYLMYD